jgi:hypothetical protein
MSLTKQTKSTVERAPKAQAINPVHPLRFQAQLYQGGTNEPAASKQYGDSMLMFANSEDKERFTAHNGSAELPTTPWSLDRHHKLTAHLLNK